MHGESFRVLDTNLWLLLLGLLLRLLLLLSSQNLHHMLVPIAVVDSSNQSTKDQLEETLKVQKKANHQLLLLANSDPIHWQTKSNTMSTIVLSRKTLSRHKTRLLRLLPTFLSNRRSHLILTFCQDTSRLQPITNMRT